MSTEIEIRLEWAIEGRLRRAAFIAVAVALAALSVVLQAVDAIPLHDAVIRRGGAVVTRGRAPVFKGGRFVRALQRELERSGSEAFLARWGDPRLWPERQKDLLL